MTPADRLPPRRARGRARSPFVWMTLVVAAVGGIGAAGVLRAADARVDDVQRIDGLAAVLAEPDDSIEYPAENYLLVGSDTREGMDPNDPDYAVVGDAGEVGGRRSDTIMILRQERNGGAALMSLPRDLWVEIAGTGDHGRINSAYNEGPERLAATVTQALGIPVHHYVEVDFQGFKDIVDQIGGVEICVENQARDEHSGLALDPGCQTLGGVQALAFARSRYYEEWDGEDWVNDPRADLGRIERQQQFIRAAVDGVLRSLTASPFSSGGTIESVLGSLRIDDRLDPIRAAQALRNAAEEGLRTYALPVENDTVGDAAVLRLGDGAEALLAYFRGQAPAPAQFETGTTVPVPAAAPG